MNSIIYTGKTDCFFINGNLYKIRYETEYGYIVYINDNHVIEIREDYILLEEWRQQRINKILENEL